MTVRECFARALGGGPLQGDDLVRFAYLDEAGFSNPKEEPYAVVAGVLLHGDRDIKLLEERLRIMARKLQPDVPDLIFHAMHIYHGSPPWDRDKFSRDERIQIIADLCALSVEFDYPVLMGFVKRDEFPSVVTEATGRSTDGESPSNIDTAIYCAAALQCIMAADSYLRQNILGPKENGMVIAEDRQKVRQHMRDAQHYLQSDAVHEIVGDRDVTQGKFAPLPLQRIVDTVHFAEKSQSSMLQLADATAFAVKRRLMGRQDGETMCAAIYDQFAAAPRQWPELGDR